MLQTLFSLFCNSSYSKTNEQLIELIKQIEESNSSNNVILSCTIITSVIALFSLIISMLVFYIQLKDRILRKKVLGYIYQYFAPTYTINNIPSTKQIKKELKNILFSEKDIFDIIIELNKEGVIVAVGNTDTILPDVKWKPNTIYYNNRKEK